jgi:hypothetical protein
LEAIKIEMYNIKLRYYRNTLFLFKKYSFCFILRYFTTGLLLRVEKEKEKSIIIYKCVRVWSFWNVQ